MKQPVLGKAALAVSVFACATMLSFDGSEQMGGLLSIGRAQAQTIDETASPALTARRSARRAGRATALGAGAAAVGAGAVTAGATAAYYAGGGPTYGARGPYYSGSGPYAYYGGNAPYVGSGPTYTGGTYAYYSGPGAWSQDYAARNGIICQPGTLIRLEDGLMHRCQ